MPTSGVPKHNNQKTQSTSRQEHMNYDGHYLSYSGIVLPLKLVGKFAQKEVENQNTFFAARLDTKGQTTIIHKIVYGEIEMEHRYCYHPEP